MSGKITGIATIAMPLWPSTPGLQETKFLAVHFLMVSTVDFYCYKINFWQAPSSPTFLQISNFLPFYPHACLVGMTLCSTWWCQTKCRSAEVQIKVLYSFHFQYQTKVKESAIVKTKKVNKGARWKTFYTQCQGKLLELQLLQFHREHQHQDYKKLNSWWCISWWFQQ